MNHQPDTPASFSNVPGHTRLFRRNPGGTYYLRAKVPQPLRPIIGKTEFRISLRTKEYKEGVARVKLESIKVDQLLAKAEAELKGQAPVTARYSREELVRIVSGWFVEEEARAEEFESEVFSSFSQRVQEIALDAMKEDNGALHDPDGMDSDGSRDLLDGFLEGEGRHLGIQKGSDDYKRLWGLFRHAKAESLFRSVNRLEKGAPLPSDARFAHLHSASVLSSAPTPHIPLGRFLDDFMAYQRKAHSDCTVDAYALCVQLLRDVLGNEAPLAGITRQHMEEVFEILRQLPVNMKQRYPNLKAREAIEAARRANDTRTLAPKTLNNNYILITAIFNYAVEERLIRENPAKSRKMRELFKIKSTPRDPALFTLEELNALFTAPLYTGCKDDGNGYSIEGDARPRRGRFWVPLIALFGGLRLNEICQLYTEDIREEEGIPTIYVRTELDDAGENEKRLKGDASRRKVPIHPELLKMGFMQFFKGRQNDQASPRLFPELRADARGRYSKIFSKWFGRFAMTACGGKPKGTFHSLRRHFRTALMNAAVPPEFTEALGGWRISGSSEIIYRHYELPKLLEHVSKVSYPGLSLEHLYIEEGAESLQVQELAPRPRPSIRRVPLSP